MMSRGGRERSMAREADRERDRERYRRDFTPQRFEEKGGYLGGREKVPSQPSRHLWVGNLSHYASETELSEHFLRFGEMESFAFHPGRSYAFVNFTREDDAFMAMRALQGLMISGLPLRIEFAKAEKSLPSSHDEHQQWRDDRRSVDPRSFDRQSVDRRSVDPRSFDRQSVDPRSVDRGASLFSRDSRTHHGSPEHFYPDKSKMGDKNAEPSEVLWIGFPTFLNVDEMVLRRAFAPFGEIVKITAFPGRSYAFVQFRTVVAACRAKEALQGKLFNSPRVSICFARSETGGLEHGKGSMNPPLPPHFKPNGTPGRSIEFRQDRKTGNLIGASHMGSPRFASDWESADSGMVGHGRRSSGWAGGSGTFDPSRLQGPQSELGLPHNAYERHSTPARERGLRRDFSPGRPRKTPFLDDPSDLPDNAFLFRETKKLKTMPFPRNNEPPEHHFVDSAQKTNFSRTFLDLPESERRDNNYGPGSFGNRAIPDRAMNLAHPHGERDDNWKAPRDRFEAGFGPLATNPAQKVFIPESREPPSSGEWKWEGTLAKGGSPICRARCFPVGKVMDFMLPDVLDCTARTGLDMLSKHFYQAASSWVVFFVPESDADITLYNEFMHYLEEKQRAAVAKLGEKTTLFLVPPSEFSEKVLKVPGKLSISGVILRFQHPNSEFGSYNPPLEAMDSKLPSFQEDMPYPKPTISTDLRSSTWSQGQGFPNIPGSASTPSYTGPTHLTGRVQEPLNESGYYQQPQQQQQRNPSLPSNWTPHHHPNSNPGTGNMFPQVSSNSMLHPPDDAKSRAIQEAGSSHYGHGHSGTPSRTFPHQESRPNAPSSQPVPSLQPDQLAQLASLLGQRQQAGSGHATQSEQQYPSSLRSNSLSDYGQVHQLLQQASNTVPQTPSREVQMRGPEAQMNRAQQNSGGREEEPDPQRRLQATLQLAATLLQQIQQSSKGVDQR